MDEHKCNQEWFGLDTLLQIAAPFASVQQRLEQLCSATFNFGVNAGYISAYV